VTPRWVPMRPEGIGRCPHGHHAVLLLREIGGASGTAVGIDESEARLLVGERQGVRSRHARTYETLEQVITGLGGTVVALHLVGDRQRGFSGEIELASDGRRVRAPAHPGDVAALAWRLNLAVLVPSDVASAPFEEDWGCEAPAPDAGPGPEEVVTSRGFLKEASPEDYDW
jgi:bifunctional DNase/RNase